MASIPTSDPCAEGSAHLFQPSGRARWTEAGLIVLFWGLIILLTIGQRAFDPRLGGRGNLMPGEAWQAIIEYTAWALLTPGIFWLSRRFRMEGVRWGQHLLLHIAIALLVAVVFNYFGFATFQWLVPETRRFGLSFLRGVMGLYFLDELIIYLVVLAAGFARDYFLRYRERLTEAIQLRTHAAALQTQLAEAKLHALRMQVNPHFLFNTLHAISSLVERDPRGVRRMIARLSTLLRYTLDGTHAQEVPLQQELSFLEGYLEIQRIRFQGKLEVELDIAPEVVAALVPNLILQPLVENAIKHGVEQVAGNGQVVVRVWREAETLHLQVTDNGPGLVSAGGQGTETGTGVGLRNTRERLESLYGASQYLVLEAVPTGGFVAHIALPYHTAADLHTAALVAQP
jgi:sensor histidine kinase YesM